MSGAAYPPAPPSVAHAGRVRDVQAACGMANVPSPARHRCSAVTSFVMAMRAPVASEQYPSEASTPPTMITVRVPHVASVAKPVWQRPGSISAAARVAGQWTPRAPDGPSGAQCSAIVWGQANGPSDVLELGGRNRRRERPPRPRAGSPWFHATCARARARREPIRNCRGEAPLGRGGAEIATFASQAARARRGSLESGRC